MFTINILITMLKINITNARKVAQMRKHFHSNFTHVSQPTMHKEMLTYSIMATTWSLTLDAWRGYKVSLLQPLGIMLIKLFLIWGTCQNDEVWRQNQFQLQHHKCQYPQCPMHSFPKMDNIMSTSSVVRKPPRMRGNRKLAIESRIQVCISPFISSSKACAL